jgi:hypothetical protein
MVVFPNHGKTWSEKEVNLLKFLHNTGQSWLEISTRIGRSIPACQMKLTEIKNNEKTSRKRELLQFIRVQKISPAPERKIITIGSIQIGVPVGSTIEFPNLMKITV